MPGRPFGGPWTPERQAAGVTVTSTAIALDEVSAVDAVLLSHDQHADNLDHSGRAYLADVER